MTKQRRILSILLCLSLSLTSSFFNFSFAIDSLKIEVTLFDLRIHYPSTGVQFYQDGIIYLLDSKLTRESNGEYVPFGSISMYYSPLKNNKLDKQIYFLRKDPFPYPADAVSFTADYNKMFFTHQSRFRGYRDNSIRMYQADIRMLKNGKSEYAKKTTELPFNSKIYSCIQPAVSPDGKFLIFASDMPGGQGGLDLYYSVFEDGNWGDPVNLGKDINSDLDESFSYIDKNGNLFFSSNGLEGYGKYDIFYSRLIKPYHWGKPVNMGPKLNSDKDDVAFTLNRNDETQGFFSSDRNVTGKQYQIFEVKIYGDIISLDQNQTVQNKNESQALKEETKTIPETNIITPKTTDTTTDKTKTSETEEPSTVQTKPEQKEPEIVFRVQLKTSSKSLGAHNVVINGNVFKTFEYYYKGAYRYTIGEFANLDEALKLNQECRKKDYPDAFVVALKGSERILDPQVFKK